MKPFNLTRLGDSQPPSLIFTCTHCNKTANQKAVSSGCVCGSRLFKVARSLNLINNPVTPYHTDEAEDGPKLTTPGDISTSVGGQAINVVPQNDSDGTHGTFPKDGTEGEEFGMPNANSDFMLPEHMKDINMKHHGPQGVYNMNGGSISNKPSVFERTRNRLWPHTERKN
jgi:predicted  nucleic acid-binding Zn-ribbon protein